MQIRSRPTGPDKTVSVLIIVERLLQGEVQVLVGYGLSRVNLSSFFLY